MSSLAAGRLLTSAMRRVHPLKRAGQAQLTLLPLVPLSSLLPLVSSLSSLSLCPSHSELASRSFTLLVPPKNFLHELRLLSDILGQSPPKGTHFPFLFYPLTIFNTSNDFGNINS